MRCEPEFSLRSHPGSSPAVVARSRLATGLAGLALAVGLSACGAATSSSTLPPTSQTTATSLASTTSATPATAATTSTTPKAPTASISSAVPECASGGLAASGHVTDPGAGSYSFVLIFVNKGTSPCTVAGYPGVSAVGPTGAQIGRSATRTGRQPGPVTIDSGKAASAVVRVAQAGDFDRTSCRPVAATGFRVFPPGHGGLGHQDQLPGLFGFTRAIRGEPDGGRHRQRMSPHRRGLAPERRWDGRTGRADSQAG